MKRVILKRFGNGWEGRMALCIAQRESGLNPRAANWRDANGGSHGLFQINGIHKGWADFDRIYVPWYNTLVAWRMSKGGRNWSAWTTRGSCS